MMSLKKQIISFVFSFLYGLLLYFLFNKFNKFFFTKNKIYNIINPILFFMNSSLIYFKIFYIINDGYISFYFILITISAFIYLQKICKSL